MTSVAVLLFIVAVFLLFNANNIIDVFQGKVALNFTLNDGKKSSNG